MTDIKIYTAFYVGWRAVEGLFALPLPVRISRSPTDGGRAFAGTSRHYNTAVNQWSPKFIQRGKIPFSKIESYNSRRGEALEDT